MVLRAWLFAAAALLALDAAAQSVGRVLVAAGDVVAERTGRDVRLATGDALLSGDLVRTGDASSAQLGFVDGSVVAMRARSRFHIEEFRFTGQDDGISRAAFRLLQGGMRTLTGLIGQQRRDRYQVATPLATVGIRGTTYSLIHCQADCEGDEGAIAPDGSYGVVFEGRVAVSNVAGEREFGAEEAFFVADANTPPQSLVSRPRFLRDRLEARARREERREALEARAQALEARRDQTAAAFEARFAGTDLRPVALAGTAASPIVVADLKDDSGNVALLGAGLGAGVGFATATVPVAVVDGGRGTVIELNGDRGFLERFAFNGGAQSGDRNDAAVLDNGRLEGDGGAVWGRWAPGAAVRVGEAVGTPSTGVHFFFGNLTPETLFSAVPAAATGVRYDYAGGPRPTDEKGIAGQFLSGSFIVNFVNRTLGGAISYAVDSVTYQLPVPSGTALATGRGFVGFNVAAQGAGTWICACNNTAGVLDNYTVSGLFLGSRAQGLGITFATQDAQAGRTAGAAVFRCVSGGCR